MSGTQNEIEADLAAFADAVSQFAQGALEPDAFRAQRVKWGIYEQRQRGTFMVRVRCTGGFISPANLADLAAIAREFRAAPLHVTTRQEIQLHGIALDNLVPVLHRLRDAGMSTRGGGGNTLRNIIVSEDSGIVADEVFDVLPHAMAVFDHLSSGTVWLDLPRKYKIAFASSERDALRARTTDLGFVAFMRDGEPGFAVYVAGGMGAKPAVGRLLHEYIPVAEAASVAAAVMHLFHRHGDRANRHKARLRFLWQTLGEEGFREKYRAERASVVGASVIGALPSGSPGQQAGSVVGASVRQCGAETSSPSRIPPATLVGFPLRFNQHPASSISLSQLTPQRQPGLFSILLPLACGQLGIDNACALADVLTQIGDDTMRCTCDQNILLRNIPAARLGDVCDMLAARFPLTKAPRIVGTAVACTGAATCTLGICRAQDALRALQDALLQTDIDLDAVADLRIALSGCPNACGQHLLADIGFCGRKRAHADTAYPAYGVCVGAACSGTGVRFAREVGEVPARALPECLVEILRHYTAHRQRHASFAAYIDAEGAADIATICAHYSVATRPNIEPEYYCDWGVVPPVAPNLV